jgi:hypothetical protein
MGGNGKKFKNKAKQRGRFCKRILAMRSRRD